MKLSSKMLNATKCFLPTLSAKQHWIKTYLTRLPQRLYSNIASAHLDKEKRFVKVSWKPEVGHNTSHYPFLWLRDNCQCPECFHPVSKARMVLMRNLDTTEVPQNVQLKELAGNGRLKITWSSGHESVFDSSWLFERRFNKDSHAKAKRDIYRKRPNKLWGSELQNNIPSDDYHRVLSDDEALYNWIVTLEDIGLFVLRNSPMKSGSIAALAGRVSFLKNTHYGELFAVKSKLDPSNVAYTNRTLGLHTDLPFYNYVPGVQMLHCIAQTPTEGGDNEFSDGFNVAQQIREEDPDTFHILTTTPLDFWDVGKDYCEFEKVEQHPVISLNESGDIQQINYNNQVRDSHLDLPLDKVEPLYKALMKFDKVLYDPKNMIHIKLSDGDIVCFHNYRVLHGRAGFQPLEGYERHLEGGYLDWDELRSRRRVLEGSGMNQF